MIIDLQHKIRGTIQRIFHSFYYLPVRTWRILQHLFQIVPGSESSNRRIVLPINRIALWWIKLLFYLLDFFAVPDFFETIMDWTKWKTRPLSKEELKLARSVYGNSLNYRRIRIDETARIACRFHSIYYVSFFTINCWGSLRPEILIHELMHVWQYQQMGAVYIPLALLAQKTPLGYDYGGLEALRSTIETGGHFENFNLEQQADIVSDYFCLREGHMPRWCTPYDDKVFVYLEHFVSRFWIKDP